LLVVAYATITAIGERMFQVPQHLA
jgi:hypothetical protein